jgi:hypothetical protein
MIGSELLQEVVSLVTVSRRFFIAHIKKGIFSHQNGAAPVLHDFAAPTHQTP